MDRILNAKIASNTLGFFVRGIPAVFYQLSIAAKADPSMNEYLDFYTRSRADPSLNPQFQTTRMVEGYEQSIVPMHETRHFHDCLLCRPLFELFLVAVRKLIVLVQVSVNLPKIRPDQLPFNVEDLGRELPEDVVELGLEVDALGRHYTKAVDRVMRRTSVAGMEISYAEILETSAMLLEIVNVLSVHGLAESRAYYTSRLRMRGAVYTSLFEFIRKHSGDWENALVMTHVIVSASLYSDEDPLLVLDLLLAELVRNSQVCLNQGMERRKTLFKDEAGLEKRIHGLRIQHNYGEDLQDALGGLLKIFQPVIEIPKMLFGARQLLIRKYCLDWNMNIGIYCARTGELPWPPAVLFPQADGDTISGVRYTDLTRKNRKVHVLCGTRTPRRGWDAVASAIVPMAGVQPFVPFKVVDLLLFAEYLWCRLMQPHGAVFFPELDQTYERQFRKLCFAS